MYNNSDAFIIFPGGIGTLDEMSEILSRKYLGFHGKPIVIYNLDGFYNGLRDLIDSMIKGGLCEDKGYFAFFDTIDEVIEYLEKTPTFIGSHEDKE